MRRPVGPPAHDGHREHDAVLVVVPARDEAARLGVCLASVDVATRRVRRRLVRVEVVVVADSCLDRTAAVARASGVHVVEEALGSVGAARARGVREGLDRLGSHPARTWVATTDADSEVPSSWLRDQLALAHAGADLAAGTVALDPASTDPETLARWSQEYARGGAFRAPGVHGHVHGANLGLAADAYLAVGGFTPAHEHEDLLLVGALLASGARAAWPTTPVRTSARTRGRTPGGFSQVMAGLTLPVPRPA
ncbi:MAG: glycosyltransferase [Nocardioidaceae bacterium]|nr:glycosyltransferase [Nocardioidaceae bacterium]